MTESRAGPLANLVTAPRRSPLPSDILRRSTDPALFATPLSEDDPVLVGQSRALAAIAFGAAIKRPGFNLFVMGPQGTGRHRAVWNLVGKQAAQEAGPDDWVYVNNFEAADKPRAIRLPYGTAHRFRTAMDELVSDLNAAIPALFESEDYKARRDSIDQEFEKSQEERFAKLNAKAEERQIAILRTPMGFAFAPRRDGKVLNPEQFNVLHKADREKVEADIAELQAELKDILSRLPRLEKERRDHIRSLNKEMASTVVGLEIGDVNREFAGIPAIAEFLAAAAADIVQNVEIFIEKAAEAQQAAVPVVAPTKGDPRLKRYTVNVIVGQAEGTDSVPSGVGAPLVSESNPTFQNLIGRIEHINQMGALVTDFTLIKPGALHRANGGYLVLDCRQLLSRPGAWEALKRALRTKEIRVTSLADEYSLSGTTTLEADPIPLSVRVILIGDRQLYYLLHALDPDFSELFKVQADFEDDADRTDETVRIFAKQISDRAHDEGLKPLAPAALARIFDEASRLADDAEKLSLRIDPLTDILREADFIAGDTGADAIGSEHVSNAIERRRDRASRLRERMHESITRETVLIDTDGRAVGQVNGLSVIAFGEQSFGRPSRITAATRLGSGKVVDIEREAKLGGPLHSKGVLILSGFLASRYAPASPMSLWASIVLEQSYGGVEGDSASSAELYALLSSLAEVPIDQSFAVTGSVNQMGAVQAIGGVNEKIEGYFDICAARGLTGRQAVLIPAANVKHLMLRSEIVRACEQGEFAVHAVERIDDGMSLLTGVAAGIRGPDGQFPPGTINARVEAKLTAYAEARRRFASDDGNGGTRSGETE